MSGSTDSISGLGVQLNTLYRRSVWCTDFGSVISYSLFVL